MRNDGRIAYPSGVQLEPKARPGVHVKSYNAMYDPELMENLNRLIDAGPFEVHVARTFPRKQAAEAQHALDTHFLGRLALRPS